MTKLYWDPLDSSNRFMWSNDNDITVYYHNYKTNSIGNVIFSDHVQRKDKATLILTYQ